MTPTDFPGLGEDMRVAGQGERCVLLVKGDAYWEILQKVGDGILIQSHNAQRYALASEMMADGYEGKSAVKVIKANGTWMYCVDSTDADHPWWYVAGKRTGGPRGSAFKKTK